MEKGRIWTSAFIPPPAQSCGLKPPPTHSHRVPAEHWRRAGRGSQEHRIHTQTPGVCTPFPPNCSLSHIDYLSLNIFICKIEGTLTKTLRKGGAVII